MKKLIFLLLLSLTLGACSKKAESTAEFNVATYNLRQLNRGDSAAGNGWDRRHPVVASLIKFHGFDIFGTQEGFKSQLEDLKRDLPGYDYIGIGREDGKDAGEHSAIFYNTDIFSLVDKGDFWLSETPDKPGLGWDAAFPASAHGVSSSTSPPARSLSSSTSTWITSARRHAWRVRNS